MAAKRQVDDATNKARVLLVDDHPLVRSGLSQLIDREADLVVCGEASDAPGALEALETSRPDVVVLDISLDEDIGGLALIKDIKLRSPKLFVLVLSMHDQTVFAERAIRAGAGGYVMKDESAETILTAIRKVLRGQIHLSDQMIEKMLATIVGRRPGTDGFLVDSLTDRELEVLLLLGQGTGTSQIAKKLHLSVKTVESHQARIKEKLKLADSAQLRKYAIQWTQSENMV